VGNLGLHPDRLARLLYPETLAFVGSLAVLVVVLAILVRLPATLAFDLKVTKELQEFHHPAVDAFMRGMTFLGNSPVLVVLCIATLAASFAADELKAGVFSLISLIALPINGILKKISSRKRPGEDEVRVAPLPRWGHSFPSGHAMGSTAVYGFLAFIVYLHMTDLAWRWGLLAPFALLPILVSTSRIYLGAHWLSDVVAGMAGGLLVVVVLAVLYPV
jgi:undecaprenyl-diphosphatase